MSPYRKVWIGAKVRSGLFEKRALFWLSVTKTGATSGSPCLRLLSARVGEQEAALRIGGGSELVMYRGTSHAELRITLLMF